MTETAPVIVKLAPGRPPKKPMETSSTPPVKDDTWMRLFLTYLANYQVRNVHQVSSIIKITDATVEVLKSEKRL